MAFDRAVRIAERSARCCNVERWRQIRDEIHEEVCERATTPDGARSPSTTAPTSSTPRVLPIPIVGFLPGDDERVTGTIDAVQRELGRDGFISRYSTAETDDGLSGDEGQFLACSFWLVERARSATAGRRRRAPSSSACSA